MISKRKEEDLEGLKKIEKMKTGSDPFIVHSIININKQELGKDYGEEWQNITKANGKQQGLCFIRNTGSVCLQVKF